MNFCSKFFIDLSPIYMLCYCFGVQDLTSIDEQWVIAQIASTLHPQTLSAESLGIEHQLFMVIVLANLFAEQFIDLSKTGSPWSSFLEVIDEGCFGPSRKLLCLVGPIQLFISFYYRSPCISVPSICICRYNSKNKYLVYIHAQLDITILMYNSRISTPD